MIFVWEFIGVVDEGFIKHGDYESVIEYGDYEGANRYGDDKIFVSSSIFYYLSYY